MDLPVTELLDDQASLAWLLKHFHPAGLHCPQCQAGVERARLFRYTRRSRVPVYRCRACQCVYNLYTGTVFEGTRLQPVQVLLLVRDVSPGEPGASLPKQLRTSRMTLHKYRRRLRTKAPSGLKTESDEMIENAGEKKRKTSSSG